MDYITTLGQSTPINNAIKLIHKLPVTDRLSNLYGRTSKNERMFIGAATFLTLYNLVSYIKERNQKKLNAPPTVPYSLPFFGHTLYLILMPNKFIDWCNKKYGEIYNIHTFGQIVTVASGNLAREVLKAEVSDLSMEEGSAKDILHLHYIFDEAAILRSRLVTPVIAKAVIPQSKMPNYIPGIQRGLEAGIKANFNADGPTIINNPSPFLQNLIAYMSVPSVLGEEFEDNIEVIKSFAEFTNDVVKNVIYWMVVPTFLHPLIAPYLHSVDKHREVMYKHVIPVVHERRSKILKAKETGTSHGLKENFLTAFIDYVLDFDENGDPIYYTDAQIIDGIFSVAFASVHTSSMNMSFCLYWLLARPDLKEKLMEEIRQIVPGDTPVNDEKLAEMKFMNNFVREALRQGVDIVTNAKKAMKDYTFSNGYQIPKGRVVKSTLRQLNFGDNSTRSTIETMDPDMSMDKLATAPTKDFVTFGAGKHICPGRFFAVQEIQMSLIYILKNFDIQMVSGKKVYPVSTIAGVIAINREDPLIFTPKKT